MNAYIITKVEAKENRLETPIIIHVCKNLAILECGVYNGNVGPSEDTYYYIKEIPFNNELIDSTNFYCDDIGVYHEHNEYQNFDFQVNLNRRGNELLVMSINYCGSDVEDLNFTKSFLTALKNKAEDFRDSKE